MSSLRDYFLFKQDETIDSRMRNDISWVLYLGNHLVISQTKLQSIVCRIVLYVTDDTL